MTTNIDEMPAGREMNALVAEKVMGWTKRRMFLAEKDYTGLMDLAARGDWVWADSSQGSGEYHHLVEEFCPTIPEEDYEAGFDPSGEIAPAWEVVEKVRPQPGDVSVHTRSDIHEWRCVIFPGPYEASGETAPLAICRAALKAVSA